MAKRVIDLETKIAEKHWDIVSVRDAGKRYNLYTRDALLEEFPSGIHWLTGMNMAPGQKRENRSEEIVVWQPDFLTRLEATGFGTHQVLAHLAEIAPHFFSRTILIGSFRAGQFRVQQGAVRY